MEIINNAHLNLEHPSMAKVFAFLKSIGCERIVIEGIEQEDYEQYVFGDSYSISFEKGELKHIYTHMNIRALNDAWPHILERLKHEFSPVIDRLYGEYLNYDG